MKENPTGKRRPKARKTPSSPYPSAPPKIPGSVEVLYHSVNSSVLESAIGPFRDQIVTSHILYQPGLLGMARVTFQGTRWEIHYERDVVKVIPFPNHSQMGEWEKNMVEKWDNRNTRSSAEGVCFYLCDSSFDFSAERFEMLQEEFLQFLISQETLELYHNPYLKIYKTTEEPEESFFARCLEEMRKNFEQEMKTLEETILRQQDRLKERLDREVRELGSDPTGLQPAARKETETGAARVPARASSERQSSAVHTQEEMDVQESIVTIEDLRKQISELQTQKEIKIKEFDENLHTMAQEREKDILRLNRANVQVLRFSLVWLPYTEFVLQQPEGRLLKLIQSF